MPSPQFLPLRIPAVHSLCCKGHFNASDPTPCPSCPNLNRPGAASRTAQNLIRITDMAICGCGLLLRAHVWTELAPVRAEVKDNQGVKAKITNNQEANSLEGRH